MKLYFMKKEALNILKNNLDLVYNKYFTESNNKWLWDVCEGDPFIEYKEVQDFHLESLESGLSKGEIELANCKIIYQKLSFITESQACDERLWAGLCHSVYYEYLRKRWEYDKKTPKSVKEAVSNIESRFFFSGSIRAGLYRNSIAKCWWVGHNTYDSSNSNPFEKLDIIGSKDIATKISDIFYNNNFSANPIILNGIVKAFKVFEEENGEGPNREQIRKSLQALNAVGGGVVLDCLNEDEVSDIIIEHINKMNQGYELGIEILDDITGYEDIDVERNEILPENVADKIEERYVIIGDKVNVRVIETDEMKIIRVDYHHQTKQIPPLAASLLGGHVGDKIEFKGNTYLIEGIKE